MEENSEVKPPESLFTKISNIRWVWFGLSVGLLCASALILIQGIENNNSLQVKVEEAQEKLSDKEKLVETRDEIDAALISCSEMVNSRIQQIDSFKGTLATISTEYKNMYSAGIGNMNIDAYIAALDNVVIITEALDAQDLGACDE